MRTNLHVVIIVVFSLFSLRGYSTACSPTTTNNSCAVPQALTVGAACATGTTCGGDAGIGASACIAAGYGECSWYSFVATSTDMYVNIDVTNNPSCFIRSNVYEGAGLCAGTELQCLSGSPMDDSFTLINLNIGGTYYVQVCYNEGGSCGNGEAADYCISVGETVLCDQCATPCGTAQGFATTPAVDTVVAYCTAPDFFPELQPSSTNTFCNTFVAINTSVSFNVIITSNCGGGGNVTNFSWSLYNSPACGAAIQTGTLASLTFTGLTIGNSYVFCYTFDVPSTCTHTKHCPYFVGSAPLPVTLMSFKGSVEDDGSVKLDWITATEINNDYFTIERSRDGVNYEEIGLIKGAGNSNEINDYSFKDLEPYKGKSYYRLSQTDFDGTTVYFNVVPINVVGSFGDLNIFPNPIEGLGYLSFNSHQISESKVVVYDMTGRVVIEKVFYIQKGGNQLKLPTSDLPQGMYFLTVSNAIETSKIKFIKE